MAPTKLDSSSSFSGDSSPNGGPGSPMPELHRFTEPIAIVGMGCRLPGGVDSSSALWELLTQERTGQCSIPPSRFNVDAFYHPKGVDRPGSMNTQGGYFLQEDIRSFDPEFFGITPLEATYMDPQQRKLLEVVFEALESSGSSLENVSGKNIGCYVGNFTVDYQVMQTRDPEYLHRYSATGMGTTILGNRISHIFNFKGPSLVLDTACSSSLYCLHVACSALESGECDAAIVAGANLIQSPEQHLGTMKAGVLSGTSTCHTFSDKADGYGRADGIGGLYLKRLSDAIRNNDPIRGIIRATAVNSNGRTPGITLPSSEGQEAVIRKCYEKAGLDFSQTAYVECHGTGTPVGDPIEAEGLSRVFGKLGRDRLLIGSVKTNLGHSEAASGISGVMKTVLALEHGSIPATVGVGNVNPKIKLDEWNLKVVDSMMPWPASPGPKRAGINSFGYGGANAHAILEAAAYHIPPTRPPTSSFRKTYLVPFSATSHASLQKRVEDLRQYTSKTQVDIRDLVYSLGVRRSHFSKRGFMLMGPDNLGDSIKLENLQTLADPVSSSGKYAFVFTGQGAQWPQMCKTLFEEFPVFAGTIMEMDTVLRNLPHPPTWSLKEAIFEHAETSKIHDVTRSQPTCTAIQVAMVMLLASWEIVPSAVMGHSSGEIAAAFAAGHLSVAEAITAAYCRGWVVGDQTMDGAMIAVGLGQEAAQKEIDAASLQGRAVAACVNSPDSTTVSGDRDAVEALLSSLNERGIFARKVNTNGRAYHSHHMAAIGQDYEDRLNTAWKALDPSSKLAISEPVTWISSVTGEKKSSDANAAYWRSNLESPVLFSAAVEKTMQIADFHFIELGPHSALEMPIKQIKSKLGVSFPYASAISRGKNEVESILRLVGGLYLHGNPIGWANVNDLDGSPWNNPKSKQKVLHDLPPYPWSYDEPLWNECRSSYEFRHRKYARHEILGSQIPGGNGVETSWRNIIRLSDIKWLPDHQLEDTIVFPGAGYVAMAIQALEQVSGLSKSQRTTYRLENVNILAALVVVAQSTQEIELFTTLKPTAITSTSSSNVWWEFNIVSVEGGMSTMRASGSISCEPTIQPIIPKCHVQEDLLEKTQARVWYQNLIRVGLNFGPRFQSIEEFWVPRMKGHNICTTKVPHPQGLEDDCEGHEEYIIHPISIDALLQTAIIATTAGSTRTLQAKVPVTFGSIIIQSPSEDSSSRDWYIDSGARVIGFGTAEIDAELRTSQGEVAMQMSNVKLAPYNAGLPSVNEEKRHPMLRLLWKPDVYGLGLMPADKFTQYLERFAAEAHSEVADEGLLKMGAALDLLSHKNPGLRILELGNDVYQITAATIDLLRGDTAFPRVMTYTSGYVSDDEELFGIQVDLSKKLQAPLENHAQIESQLFDVILLPFITATDSYLAAKLPAIQKLMSPEAVLLALSPSTEPLHSAENGFEAITSDLSTSKGRVILARALDEKPARVTSKAGESILVVDRGVTPLSKAVTAHLTSVTGSKVSRLSINEVSPETVPSHSVIFSLLESEKPLLVQSTDYQMEKVKILTDRASKLVWVTRGNLLEAGDARFGLVNGLSRALMMEQPSLTFITFDIDNISAAPIPTAKNIVAVLSENQYLQDFEFVQRSGVVHVSRFVPDDSLNSAFRQKQGNEELRMSLRDAQPVQLSIAEAGNFDSIHFRQITLPRVLEPGKVQVAVKRVGLNAKDYYVLGGKTETRNATCMLEFCGVVERVGEEVKTLSAGDHVVVMAPSYFGTSEIVPAWACLKLHEDEALDLDAICTLPVVYATALYALRDRAHLQRGETVLIHSGAGGVGIAAIQVAQEAGAEVFTTVSSEDKKKYLVERFGLQRDHIFSSRDVSFLPGVMVATNNRGVDVVLNSLTGDLLHASWKCCASFGRFVEIGKRDLVDCGRLEMEQFLQNASFSAFDLSNMYYHSNPEYHKKWASLLAEVLELYRTKKIQKIEPLKVFDVTNVTQALRYFSSRNRIGKIAVSLDLESELHVRPQRYKTFFSPEKDYVMVGCLGGLGRSMAKWMMARGARKFRFLGRSGTDKASARNLITELQRNGATCTVIRGDVCNMADVQALVESTSGQIGGVIQAAMGLNESLFTAMSNHFWHTGIDPKVVGTLNLHEAIKGKDGELDFFLMTSSVSGSVGTATESNYCAGNYFLDCFARHRRSLGLPAMAIGLGMISEVGYLHENPEIEQLLLRKGIQAINEDELLQIIDIALSSDVKMPHAYDDFTHSHILTGLEPFGLKAMRKKGFEGTNPTLNDPRASILGRALDGENDLALKGQTGRLPAEVSAQMEAGSTLAVAILSFIAKRFSNLVLIPLDKLDVAKPLSAYGMDSMIAAEFRTWFFQALKIDIAFLELLSKTVTLTTLSQRVVGEVEAED
ncbi:hypothetical protein B7494_g6164 [Chlorociboria aeruginascens]|nr:hypothetical protein B7494_g6164 [Chlorociboria aeruginascens]